jgi:hypothetical protein
MSLLFTFYIDLPFFASSYKCISFLSFLMNGSSNIYKGSAPVRYVGYFVRHVLNWAVEVQDYKLITFYRKLQKQWFIIMKLKSPMFWPLWFGYPLQTVCVQLDYPPRSPYDKGKQHEFTHVLYGFVVYQSLVFVLVFCLLIFFLSL